MIKTIKNSALDALKNIKYGFFTRHGGVSEHWYASLNCSSVNIDQLTNLIENKRRITEYLGYPLDCLVTIKNIHSNHAYIVQKPLESFLNIEGDGLVTDQQKVILGSNSADCPIVLLADPVANVIGLAHAGWRGAKAGILEATIEKMMALGAKPCHMTAAISPSIHQDFYEVNFEFYTQFINEHTSNQIYFKESARLNYFFFNLIAYVSDRLTKLKVQTISVESALDTYSNADDFFSCRRAKHLGEEHFGGHFSCICLDSESTLQ